MEEKAAKKKVKKPDRKEGKRVRTLVLRIGGAEDGDWQQTFRELLDASRDMQRAKNYMMMRWLSQHLDLDSGPLVQTFMDDLVAWNKSELPKPKKDRNPKPTCAVTCWSYAFANELRLELMQLFPRMHGSTLGAAINKLGSYWNNKPASKSAFHAWQLVLTNQGEFQSFSRPQPLPFSRRSSSSRLLPPTDEAPETWRLRLAIARIPRDGKVAATQCVTLLLDTKGHRRGIVKHRESLEDALLDPDQYSGCDLSFRESEGRWYAHICLAQPRPKPEPLDPYRVAFLHGGRKKPWLLRLCGQPTRWWCGGRGRGVIYARRRTRTERLGRQESYQFATSNRRGHGRERGVGRLPKKLRELWTRFVDTHNKTVARRVANACRDAGCGTLIYYQPSGKKQEVRFLWWAGKDDVRRDPTSWEWHRMGAILQRACEDVGVTVFIRQVSIVNKARRIKLTDASGQAAKKTSFSRAKPAQRKRGKRVAKKPV